MEQKEGYGQFKGQTRLPEFAVPKRYDLTLRPDLSVCTFSGTVLVDLCIVRDTRFLVLNALDLAIHEALFTDSQNRVFHPSDVVVDGDDEIVVLVFDQTLGVGEGVLRIEFSGKLNEHLKGFYRCSYMDGEEKKNMAVTQFEAVEARRCFACWDEPALKATFKITVDVPSNLTALSNMPSINEKINGHLKSVYFEETPIMSTYLVAVVIGLFDHIEETTSDGTKVCVYCSVGQSHKGKFALDVAVKTLDLYKKYFSVPYALPKLDMVAVPEFAAGAMENYGLIVYRETDLLHDDLQSTAANKQRVAIVTAHEVAHQWFGNLVTMEWWTHLWLNEGFATWVSYLAIDSLFPEWKVWTQFIQFLTGGLHLDALEQTHPIEVEIHHARSIEELFDAVSYEKGSAIIRMLQYYLGDSIFQKSLSSYIKRYACKNAKTEDLWSILSEESSIEVNKMMEAWTKQKGYPVISVKSNNHILEFEQLPFLSSGLHGDGQWVVPITLSLGSYSQCKHFLLETKVGQVDISELFHSSSSLENKNGENCDQQLWVKINVEQTGFYRVKYEDKLAAQLWKAVENNCLSATDKFGILDDTYALSEACELSLSSLLSLMNVYRKELDYIVVSRLIDICYNVAEVSSNAIPNLVNQLKQFFTNLLLFSAEKLGWEPKSGESHMNAMLRGEVLMGLANFGHDKTHEEAIMRFQMFLNDRSTVLLPADLRRAAYIAVMRNSSTINRDGFESLLKIYREADTVQEKARVLRSMAASPDPSLVLEALNLFLTDEIRDQDIIYGFVGISIEGRETAWRWLKENWGIILKKWGSGVLIANVVRDIVTPFCSYDKADEVEAFFANRGLLSIAMTLKQSVEQVRIKARWVQNIQLEEGLGELFQRLAACRG